MKTKFDKQITKLIILYRKKYDCFGKERNDSARVQRKK
jgi:hypothetical protein